LKYLTLKQLACACDGAKEVNADCGIVINELWEMRDEMKKLCRF
jgi:hypothetical protein